MKCGKQYSTRYLVIRNGLSKNINPTSSVSKKVNKCTLTYAAWRNSQKSGTVFSSKFCVLGIIWESGYKWSKKGVNTTKTHAKFVLDVQNVPVKGTHRKNVWSNKDFPKIGYSCPVPVQGIIGKNGCFWVAWAEIIDPTLLLGRFVLIIWTVLPFIARTPTVKNHTPRTHLCTYPPKFKNSNSKKLMGEERVSFNGRSSGNER
jgi:hypothetical protein